MRGRDFFRCKIAQKLRKKIVKLYKYYPESGVKNSHSLDKIVLICYN